MARIIVTVPDDATEYVIGRLVEEFELTCDLMDVEAAIEFDPESEEENGEES